MHDFLPRGLMNCHPIDLCHGFSNETMSHKWAQLKNTL